MDTLRNLPIDQPRALASLVEIRPGRVVSMALSRSEHCQMTLLAFAEGESVSDEEYFGDTLYTVLEGEMPLNQGGQQRVLKAGESLRIPARTPHAIGGGSAFKLLQITVSD